MILNNLADMIQGLPGRIMTWPEWVDVVIALAILLILASIPQTSKLAVWIAVAILGLQILARKAGNP